MRGALRGGSRGVTLIEALVAMALVAIIAVAFLGALTTAARSAALADIRTNAESLARSELEYVKSQPYSLAPWEYEATSDCATCEPEVAPDWC
ncbi:MAG: prepilin-type N-terminal cleavage/methylation domain-containing protein, partial [Dehalococcoidia bacterium]